MLTARILPFSAETTVEELARVAQRAGMHLISNGHKVVVSPVVPQGFIKIAVKIKTPTIAHLEAVPCAA